MGTIIKKIIQTSNYMNSRSQEHFKQLGLNELMRHFTMNEFKSPAALTQMLTKAGCNDADMSLTRPMRTHINGIGISRRLHIIAYLRTGHFEGTPYAKLYKNIQIDLAQTSLIKFAQNLKKLGCGA